MKNNYFYLIQMIKRTNRNIGVNANVSLEPNSAASSNNNFNNNIYVQTPYPTELKATTSTFTERDVLPSPEAIKPLRGAG